MTTTDTSLDSRTIRPCVNLNGSSGEELVEQVSNQYHALIKLQEALGRACPHGRDYQGADAGRYTEARAEYDRRRALLRDLEQALMRDHDHLLGEDR